MTAASVRALPFGDTPEGPAELLLLEGPELQLGVSTLGAAVHRLRPRWGSADGRDADGPDLVLGLPDAAAAFADDCYVGATVGRYANRIAQARLPLDGRTHRLEANDGPHALHGGRVGFNRRLWRVTEVQQGPAASVRMELTSPDGDMGFPGALDAVATFTVDGWSVRVELMATASAPTVVNLTQHAYWNLTGTAGDVRGHEVRVAASHYLPVDDDGIPTTGPVAVAGTDLDRRAGGVLRTVRGGVFDHCMLLDDPGLDAPQMTVREPGGGWSLDISTDAPAVQLYTGAALTGRYAAYDGLCLETQWLPDTPRHEGEAGWPTTVLRPGETWRSTTIWRIGPPSDWAQRRP